MRYGVFKEHFAHTIQLLGTPFFDNMQTRHFLDGYVERVTENDLEKGATNSSSFELIGLTEEYPEFIRRFAEINGLKPPPTTSALNRSSSPPLFDLRDTTIKEILSPLVCHDIKLHNHIRRSHNSRIS